MKYRYIVKNYTTFFNNIVRLREANGDKPNCCCNNCDKIVANEQNQKSEQEQQNNPSNPSIQVEQLNNSTTETNAQPKPETKVDGANVHELDNVKLDTNNDIKQILDSFEDNRDDNKVLVVKNNNVEFFTNNANNANGDIDPNEFQKSFNQKIEKVQNNNNNDQVKNLIDMIKQERERVSKTNPKDQKAINDALIQLQKQINDEQNQAN